MFHSKLNSFLDDNYVCGEKIPFNIIDQETLSRRTQINGDNIKLYRKLRYKQVCVSNGQVHVEFLRIEERSG